MAGRVSVCFMGCCDVQYRTRSYTWYAAKTSHVEPCQHVAVDEAHIFTLRMHLRRDVVGLQGCSCRKQEDGVGGELQVDPLVAVVAYRRTIC